MLVPYGIPSQKNKAKKGLTLRVKLEQFPTLHKHISFRFIKKNNVKRKRK